MKTIKFYILIACLLFVGCDTDQPQKQQGQYEQVSEQIEEIKSQAEAQTEQQTGEKPDTGAVEEQKLGNIKVTVKKLTVEERDFSALDSLWEYAPGDFVIYKRPDIFHESGLKVGISRSGLKAQIQAVREKTKSSEMTEMFLVVADGSEGYINMGREILIPQFYYLNRWYKQVNYQFKSAGRSFKVLAVRIPGRDLINLRITPVFSNFLDDGSTKEFTELMTNVTIKAGESVLIGGSRSSYENLASALLGRSVEKGKTDTVIIVEASLL